MQRKVHGLLLVVLTMTGAVPAAAQDLKSSGRTIKIGVLNDRSGPYSDATGEGSAIAARLAAEEFDNKIQGVPVEIVVGDHLGKPDTASSIARRWFDNEQVDVIADIASSGVGFAVVNLGKERNKIILNNSASSDFTGKACTATSLQWSYNTYANSKAFAAALLKDKLDTFFVIVVDYAYGHALAGDLRRFVEAGGGKIIGESAHPLNTTDYSSYLLQAQSSGAKVVALANSGADLVNTLKQAAEFGIAKKQALVVASAINLPEIEALGLELGQGLLTTSSFEWNRTPAAREWTKRFIARSGKFPSADQAATYSEVRHYLKAVAAAGTVETAAVMAKMRELPVNDAFAENGRVREDGQMVHDLFLVRAKKPSESMEKGDYFSVVSVISGNDAFQPLSESVCPILAKK